MALPTRQQMEDFAFATWESTKAGTGALAEAGMFKLDNVVAFTKDLGRPVNKKYITAEGFQEIVLAKMPELHVRARAFTAAAAAALASRCGTPPPPAPRSPPCPGCPCCTLLCP